MDAHTRLAGAITRIATATSITRTRAYDAARAERNGDQADQLEAVVARLERVADELWTALDESPSLKRAA